MKKKIIGCLLLVLLTSLYGFSQETLKVMFYNLLNYPDENTIPNREQYLDIILSDYQPDLFLVCELNNSSGASTVLNIAQNAISQDIEMTTYVSNTSDDTGSNQNSLQNLLYYNSSKFILEEEIIVPTDLRDFNIYKLKLNSIDQDTNPVELYVIVCHLKASSGPENEIRRLNMVLELETYLNTLPANANVLLGGDLNIYTASEPAFQQLINMTNNITLTDPANRLGDWSNNSIFVDVFTQSTRTQSGLGGTAGGLDDRFDFILTSENMTGTANINCVPDSYQTYGNNGFLDCFNSAINSSNCGDTTSEFSFEIRDALHNFSDHLPVTVILETDANLLSINTIDRTNLPFIETTVVRDYLNIYNTDFKLSNKTLVLYNSLGKPVKSWQLNSDPIQRINLNTLQSGMYVMSVHNYSVKPEKIILVK